MRAFVELNGYAEGVGDESRFRPIGEGISVGSLPVTVVVRAVWRTEPGDDDPPGYVPFARLVLAHAEPGALPPQLSQGGNELLRRGRS